MPTPEPDVPAPGDHGRRRAKTDGATAKVSRRTVVVAAGGAAVLGAAAAVAAITDPFGIIN